MYDLIDACQHRSIDEILEMPDVRERTKRYAEQDTLFREMLVEHSWTEGDVIITDLRSVDTIFAGNRFLVYALHPEQNVSVWIVNGFQGRNCVFACGHSIVNKSSDVNIGALMREYGGGGHVAAGTCQVSHETASTTLRALVGGMNKRVLTRAA